MGNKSTTTDLALARRAWGHAPTVFINNANVKWRYRKTEVATARNQWELNAHHGEAPQFHHSVAINQGRRDSEAARQARKSTEFPQTLPDFGG